MNEEREAVADRAIKSDQQRKRKYQLGSAQGVRCRHCECHPVKVAGDARRRIRKNQFLAAPLQQKDGENVPQDETPGVDAVAGFGGQDGLPWSVTPVAPTPRALYLTQFSARCTPRASDPRVT